MLWVNVFMFFGVMYIVLVFLMFMVCYLDLLVEVNFDDCKIDVIEGGFDVLIWILDMVDFLLIVWRFGFCKYVVVVLFDYFW